MKKHPSSFLIGIAAAAITLLWGPVNAAAAAPTQADEDWQSPFVAIAWPHNGSGTYTPVGSSKAVNISVWPSNSVSCINAPAQPITLWQAANNEPAAQVDKEPEFFVRTQNNVRFPSMEFNNIPADIASNTANRYYFMLGGWRGNVWVDATDARTYLPNPVQPTGFSGSGAPAQIDTRIQIVYPHDKQGAYATVDKATLDNVAVDLFEHGTKKSVPVGYAGGPLVLYMAEANLALSPAQADHGSGTTAATAHLEPYKVGGVTYPRWVFNDVKVQPGKQYHFVVRVQGVDTFPTVWTHSQDVRTYLPNPPTPPPCFPITTEPPPDPTPCALSWFTPVAAKGSCPNADAQQYEAAFEPFEHGAMIWRKGPGFDILRSDINIWEGWQDDLTICRDTSSSVTAPAGLFAPASGFGYLWRGDADYCTYTNPNDFDHNHFRNILGWATSPETGYTAKAQTGKLVDGQTVVLYTYISLPDGKIVELSRAPAPNQFTYYKIITP